MNPQPVTRYSGLWIVGSMLAIGMWFTPAVQGQQIWRLNGESGSSVPGVKIWVGTQYRGHAASETASPPAQLPLPHSSEPVLAHPTKLELSPRVADPLLLEPPPELGPPATRQTLQWGPDLPPLRLPPEVEEPRQFTNLEPPRFGADIPFLGMLQHYDRYSWLCNDEGIPFAAIYDASILPDRVKHRPQGPIIPAVVEIPSTSPPVIPESVREQARLTEPAQASAPVTVELKPTSTTTQYAPTSTFSEQVLTHTISMMLTALMFALILGVLYLVILRRYGGLFRIELVNNVPAIPFIPASFQGVEATPARHIMPEEQPWEDVTPNFDLGPSYEEEMRMKEENAKAAEAALLQKIFEQNMSWQEEINQQAAPVAA